jgi:urease accessory protein
MAAASTASDSAEALASAALAQLLRLASPALPVGAFSYSQGMEWAVDVGWIHDESSAAAWIGDLLRLSMARYELPILARLLRAGLARDAGRVVGLNAGYLAAREAREPVEESVQMGHSLLRLMDTLPEFDGAPEFGTMARPPERCAWPTAFALACARLSLPVRAVLTAYAFAWCENQCSAAIKLVPLGQSAGQRILSALISVLPGILDEALAYADASTAQAETEWGADLQNALPALAIACASHETQYSRLFRS